MRLEQVRMAGTPALPTYLSRKVRLTSPPDGHFFLLLIFSDGADHDSFLHPRIDPMTCVAVIGADGMIGRKLLERLRQVGSIGGKRIERLVSADIRPPSLAPAPFEEVQLVGDMSESRVATLLAEQRPDIVFHVAATFMGQADLDFSAGYRINFFTLFSALDAIRTGMAGAKPRLVYASSIGVYGAPFPAVIDDAWPARPDSSYGTQKLMCEAVVNDYSRLGFIDGVALRLPTIAIRPGAPTHGNSGFFSNIIREPLNGRTAGLPASPDVRHWIASPSSAVDYLLHAAAMDTGPLDGDRALVMPGLAVSVAEQLDALRRVGGDTALDLVRAESPPLYGPADFPQRFTATRALDLGFAPREADFDDIVSEYLGTQAGRAL